MVSCHPLIILLASGNQTWLAGNPFSSMIFPAKSLYFVRWFYHCHVGLPEGRHENLGFLADLPWFTLIYHDIPWFTMIYHDVHDDFCYVKLQEGCLFLYEPLFYIRATTAMNHRQTSSYKLVRYLHQKFQVVLALVLSWKHWYIYIHIFTMNGGMMKLVSLGIEGLNPQFFLGQMVQRKIWDLAWFSR